MEMREFAANVVRSTRLEVKLAAPPETLTDAEPGPAWRATTPGRPPHLTLQPPGTVKVPKLAAMADDEGRRRILHAFANHELQAAELFAWALLAFPEAPAEMRRGLLRVLLDEQRHTLLYMRRFDELGMAFGDYPVNGYFWRKTPQIGSPLAFVCAMSLTFEHANLDHTIDYADAARRAGDEASAALLDRIHRDEIEHVRFGWRWLRRLAPPGQTPFDAYRDALTWPLRPAKARGRNFHHGSRHAAGLDEEFIQAVADSEP